jgi:hypothetical protein
VKPLRWREIVATETPTCLATSVIVTVDNVGLLVGRKSLLVTIADNLSPRVDSV